MKNVIPVFYACDDAFVKYTIVSIKSLLDNLSKDSICKIYILNTNISDEMKQHVKGLETADSTIEFVDVTPFLTSIQDKLPLRHYYSKTTYYRLFIAEIFKEYDKAIYIDSDTLVLADINQLYSYDVSNYYVGACHEQVMRQVPIFGTYVEEVLGMSRYNFFNAGILLINCDKFRTEKVLDQFIDLLGQYNFIVTQDEDYLNLICENKVLWLPQQWNTEVINDILYPVEEVKIFHFIMTSKPWNYKDAQHSEYFWQYAKKTSVYELIVENLNNYSDAEKLRDKLSGDHLVQMAIDEIDRPDNYLKRKKLKG